METFPYDNLEQLAVYIENSSSSDPNIQKPAFDYLEEMGKKDVLRFSQAIISFLITDDLPPEKQPKLKRVACMLFPSIILNEQNQTTDEEKDQILTLIYELLFSNKLDFLLKPTLQPALLGFYKQDDGQLRTAGFNKVLTKLSAQQLDDCYSSFIILITLINSTLLQQKTAAEWFAKLLEGLNRSGVMIVNGVILELQKMAQGVDENSIIANVFMGATALKVWMDIVLKFTNLLGNREANFEFDPKYLTLLITQEKLLDVISKILILHIPNDNQLLECLFSMCGNKAIDDLLNSLKTLALECLGSLLEYLQELKVVPFDPTINKFYGFMRSAGAKYILDSVQNFCQKIPDIDAVLDENTQLQNCLVDALKFLTRLTYQKELKTAFFVRRHILIADVCFPLIRTGTQEQVDFQEDPEQFVLLAIDCFQRQHSETAKTQAVQFIEKLCLNVEGYLSFVTGFSIQIIHFSLVSNDLAAIPEKFQRLTNFQNTVFLVKTDAHIRVETCLLVLANLGYQITQRDDLLPNLEKLFIQYKDYFGNDAYPLIHARLCLFLGGYLESIFKKEEHHEYFKFYLGFLLKCVGLLAEDVQAVAELAQNSFCIIFDHRKGPNPRIDPFLTDILDKFAEYIKEVKVGQFFELLFEFTRTYEVFITSNPEPFLKLVKLLVDRGEEEYKYTKEDTEYSDFILLKIWNTIRSIVERPSFVENFQVQVEEILTPLIAHLENDDKLPYETEILEYMVAVIKIRKDVTETFWIIFKLFRKIFDRQGGMIWHLFHPINQIIIHGKDRLNSEPEAVADLVKMIIEGLNPKSSKANSANYSEAAILLQLAFQYLTIPDLLWEEIIVQTLAKMKSGRCLGYIMARLCGVILTAFLTNFELTQAILVHMKELEFVLSQLLDNVIKFETHPYDRKVFLIGLSNFVLQDPLNPMILERLPAILATIVPIFKYVELIEQIEISKTNAVKETNPEDEDYVHRFSDPDFLKRFLSADAVPKDPRAVYNAVVSNQQIQGEEVKEGDLPNGVAFDGEVNDLDGFDTDDDDDDEDDYLEDFPVRFTAEEISNKALDQFETKMKDMDEFKFFRDVVLKLKEVNIQRIEQLYETLPEQKQKFMKEILHSQRVTLDEPGKSQARRIVKPRTRKLANLEDLKPDIKFE